MHLDKFLEVGSSKFVWNNISPNNIFSNIQLHLHYAHDMKVGKEWAGSEFVNDYNRIYYFVSGEAEIVFKNQSIIMEPGSLYFIPPYSLKSHKAYGDMHFYWAHFNAITQTGNDLFLTFNQPQILSPKPELGMRETFAELIKRVQSPKPHETLFRNMLLLQIMAPFFKVFENETQNFHPTMGQEMLKIISQINSDPANAPDVRELAVQANLSLEHFSRKFKSEFNIPPKRYILLKRIELARRLLVSENQNVGDIGKSCGFVDPFHFSKSFKSIVGMTPSNFRKSANKAFP